jgi:hypothetical protein
MNGDGRDDVLGTWSSGIYYLDSLGGSWVYMSVSADLIAAGDLDGDYTDDLIGVWSNGLWVKYSSSGTWARLSKPLPTDIAAGDMNGDGRDDVLGTWSTGTFYRNTVAGNWVYLSTPSHLVAAGDVDGDGSDDLIGTWGGAYTGLWAKYSSTMSWRKICVDLPVDIDAGMFRDVALDADAGEAGGMQNQATHYSVGGPGSLSAYEDLTDEGPGGWNFVYREERHLIPLANETEVFNRIPGPGEPGFFCVEQKNVLPIENSERSVKK